ncbi:MULTISPECIES: hypothetical protein [unclassified Nocardioides]|uniref:hypothetical protein n=1 Tax=Nocardioides sp. URHA0032 TaxID=1380388 RepID=UPI0004919ECB|nr:hypothetical protein [Nocardioides sp. URHA0032]
MNTTNARLAAATATAATAAVVALGPVSASPANANRPAPSEGCSTTPRASTASMDIDQIVTMLKVQRAQYLIDHPRLLR